MTTFQEVLLNRLDTVNQSVIDVSAAIGSGGGGTQTINASINLLFFSGQINVTVPPSISASIVVTRGNGTLTAPFNLPLVRNFNLDLPFRSFNYLYPQIEFTLNTGNSEAYVFYELTP
ncbi:MAG: hypothetical protein QNJ38_01440 [Prochloraceae cyanobacterium]|nr:hypothetical protein [Prochloraceae cyanobacterium]